MDTTSLEFMFLFVKESFDAFSDDKSFPLVFPLDNVGLAVQIVLTLFFPDFAD